MRRHFLVDCETTSLIPSYADGTGVIWELALCERGPEGQRAEYLYRIEPDLAKADPGALRVGRYYERTARMRHRDSLTHDLSNTPASRGGVWSNPAALASLLARLLDDATLTAANPTFDASFMAGMLRAYGQAPTWHYRLRDFGSLAYGWLQAREQVTRSFLGEDDGVETGRMPRQNPAIDASTDEFALALGVDLSLFDRHSALGDVRLIGAGLDVIEGVKPQ